MTFRTLTLCTLLLVIPAHAQKMKPSAPFPFEFPQMGIGEMKDLGISDQQMQQISAIYENNRHNLIDLGADVAKKEGDVRVLLDAPQVDTAQVDRAVDALIEARGRLSKSTTMMMVKMRQILTADQWRKLDDYAQARAQHPEYSPRHPAPAAPRPPEE